MPEGRAAGAAAVAVPEHLIRPTSHQRNRRARDKASHKAKASLTAVRRASIRARPNTLEDVASERSGPADTKVEAAAVSGPRSVSPSEASTPRPWTTATVQCSLTTTAMSHMPDRNRPGKPFAIEPDAPPIAHDAPTRIYAFVEDLFFLAKINETARKLGVKVEFVKTEKEVFERMGQNGNEKPALIIVDLNNLNVKPLTVIPKLKSKLKKETNIIGFVSHVQGELKMKATEAGCDMVLPRSAFSQNLAQLMRRHTAQEEDLSDHPQPN